MEEDGLVKQNQNIEVKCKEYENFGFISATICHTLLNRTYKEAKYV